MSLHSDSLPKHWSWFSLLPETWHDMLKSISMYAGGFISQLMGRPADEKWFFGGGFDVLHVWSFLFVVLLLLGIGVSIYVSLKNTEQALIPESKPTLRNFAEIFIHGILTLMSSIMGEKNALYFLPLIGTCACIILFSNILGLIPGFLPPTDNLNTCAAMAAIIFVATHVYGVKKHGFKAYIKHFMGPIPAIAPLILLIELVSHVVRPLTLSIRLTANMFADHAVLGAFLGLSAAAFLLPFPVAVYVLGIIVSVVQTLVFCLLSMVYIGSAVEEHEHH